MRHNSRDPLQPLPQGRLIEGPKPHLIGQTAAEEAKAVLQTLASATVEAHAALCEKVARQVQAAGVVPKRCQWHSSRNDPWERFLVVDGLRVAHIFAEWGDGGTVRFVSEPMGPDHARQLPPFQRHASYCPVCETDAGEWLTVAPPQCATCGWVAGQPVSDTYARNSEEGNDEEPDDGDGEH